MSSIRQKVLKNIYEISYAPEYFYTLYKNFILKLMISVEETL